MTELGMCLLLWTDDAVGKRWIPILRQLKRIGYARVDVPIFKTGERRYRGLRRTLDALGLAASGVTALLPDQHLISDSKSTRERGVDHLRRAIDSTAALGGTLLSGPLFAGLGVFSGKPPTKREWEYAVSGLRAAAEHADSAGVGLALEYLNRFEVYLVNCAEDAARLVRAVDHPRLRLAFDTFHANIEEKDIEAAIVRDHDLLVSVQLSENDRSTPGAGGVPWERVFAALSRVDYQGALSIEAFGQGLPALAAATKIWRPMFGSELGLAADAFAFVQGALRSAKRARPARSRMLKRG